MSQNRRLGDRRKTVRRQSQPNVIVDGALPRWTFPIESTQTVCGNCGASWPNSSQVAHRCPERP